MKSIFLIFLFVMLIFLSSCEDFIEKDISDKSVTLLSPPDGYTTSTLTQTFWWEELDGAENYRMQIAKPSFSNAQQFIIDTTVTSTNFTHQFVAPGAYQWRVKAMNNGSETAYFTRTLNIDSTLDLSTQVVVLISPANNHISSDTIQTFVWNSLYNSTLYRFQLVDNSTSFIVKDTATTDTQLTTELVEGDFKWQVRAENDFGVSPYSSRNIIIDITFPSVSAPGLPANGDTVSTPVDLSWHRQSSAVADSLLIYADSALTNISLSVYTTDTTYSFNAVLFNDYFWRLKSIDAAGNQSGYSSVYKFYVQ
jgi:hypothetical protein